MAAALGNSVELERSLSQLAPKDINIASNSQDGDTPLGAAARAGRVEVLLRLLDVPQIDVDAGSPIHIASHAGFSKIVALLLFLGANPRRPDHSGKSALDSEIYEIAELFFNYYDQGPSSLLPYLESLPAGRVADSVASSRWLRDPDASKWSAVEVMQFLEANDLGFLEHTFQPLLLAEETNTSVDDASHFFSAMNAAESHQRKGSKSKLKFVNSVAEPLRSGSHRARATPSSMRDKWAKFFELDASTKNRVLLKRTTLDTVVEFIALPAGDPLLRLWDRDAFLRELLLTYRSFTTSSALLDSLESKVGEFSGRSANPWTTAVCSSIAHFLAQWVLADNSLYRGEIFMKDDVLKARLSDFWNAHRQYEGAFTELGKALFGAEYKQSTDNLITIFLFGFSGVGRTALLKALVSNQANRNVVTNSSQEEVTDVLTVIANGSPFNVQIRSPPSDAFSGPLSSVRGIELMAGAMLVFDITDRDSLKPLLQWYTAGAIRDPQLEEVLVGTHADLDIEREISIVTAQEWAQARGIRYEEVSSRTNRNIREFFERFVAAASTKSRFSQGLTLDSKRSLRSLLPRQMSEGSLLNNSAASLPRLAMFGATIGDISKKANASSSPEKLTPLRSLSRSKAAAKSQTQLTSRSMKLEDLDLAALARQLYLGEFAILQKIKPSEFYHRNWLSQSADTLSPAISEMIKFSAKLRNWVFTEVLSQSALKDATRLLSVFIVLAKELDDLNSFNSLRSFVTALRALLPVKAVWEGLLPVHRVALDGMSRIFIGDTSSKSYEDRLARLVADHASYLPQLASVLIELKSLDGSTKDFSSTLVNWEKMALLSSKISGFFGLPPKRSIVDDAVLGRFVSKLKPWEEPNLINGALELRSKSRWFLVRPDYSQLQNSLPQHLTETLLTGCSKVTLQAEDDLRVTWADAGSIYFVHAGQLTRYRGNDVIARYQPGQFVALENFLGVSNVSDRLVAASRCQLSVVTNAFIRDLCRADLDFAELFYRFVSLALTPTVSLAPEVAISSPVSSTPVTKSKLTNILGTESTSSEGNLSSIFPDSVGSVLKTIKCHALKAGDESSLASGTFYVTQGSLAFDGLKLKTKSSNSQSKPMKFCVLLGEIGTMSVSGVDLVLKFQKKEYRVRFRAEELATLVSNFCRVIATRQNLSQSLAMTATTTPSSTSLTATEWRQIVLRGAELRTFQKDAAILHEGRLNHHLYQLARGSVILKSPSSALAQQLNEPSDKYAAELPSHASIFGQEAFVHGGFSSVSAKAAEDNTALYAIPEEYLRVAFESVPGFGTKFFKYMAVLAAQAAGFTVPSGVALPEDEASIRSAQPTSDVWLSSLFSATNKELRSSASPRASAVSYDAAAFDKVFHPEPEDLPFLDHRTLYLISTTPLKGSAEKNLKVLKKLIASLSGTLVGSAFFGGRSHSENLAHLWSTSRIDVVVVEVDSENAANVLSSSIPSSRLCSIFLIVPPTPSKTISFVQTWLSTNRPRLFCQQFTPPVAETTATMKALKGLKQSQVAQFSSAEILRTWEESEWFSKLVVPLYLRSHLFDFSAHVPGAEDIFSWQNYFVLRTEGVIKLLDRSSGRCVRTILLDEISRALSVSDRPRIETVISSAISADSNKMVLLTKSRASALVSVLVIDLTSGRPVSLIDPQCIPYMGTRMVAALVNDFFLVAPDRVLHIDADSVYCSKPVFAIRTLDGTISTSEFSIPSHRINASQIFVWERSGKFKRGIGRDDAVELLSGNERSLVAVSVVPSPEDPSNLVSVVEVITKSPTQVAATFVDQSISRYDAVHIDEDWLVLESGNHQDLHFLDLKSAQVVTRRTATFSSLALIRGYHLAAAISKDGEIPRIELIDPRREDLVATFPLSILGSEEGGQSDDESGEELMKWRRLKIFVLGEENIGKTHLVRSLCGQKYASNISTEGIEVMDDRFGEFVFRFMDFGGQEVFYPTHQLFLTGNAVYVIVFNMANPNWSRVEYWLMNAQQYGERAPVVLVGTHADHFKRFDPAEFDKKISTLHLAKRLVKRSFYVSNLKPDSLREIKPYLAQLAYDFASIKRPVPAEIGRLVPYVERSKAPYMKWSQFAAMVGLDARGSELKFVTHFLYEAGSLLWYKDTPLSDIVILDPRWLSSLFSTVVSFKNKWRDGRLSASDFDLIWKPYPRDFHSKLIGLLERFDIAFPMTGEDVGGHWLIPSMFADTPPPEYMAFVQKVDALVDDDTWRAERDYQFDFLPYGLFPRVVMRFLQNVFHLNLVSSYWREGIVFQGAKGELVLIEWQKPANVIRAVYRSSRSKRSGVDELFITLVHSIDALLSSQDVSKYPVQRLCQCPLCFRSGSFGHLLLYDDIAASYQRGDTSVAVSAQHAQLAIKEVAPDVFCEHVCKVTGTLEGKVELGVGAYGRVFKARLSGKDVAVKELINVTHNTFREFLHEVTLMSALKHGNIVSLVGISTNPLSMVMELCPQGSLDTLLYKKLDSPISEVLRFKIARDIAAALAYLHSLVPPLIHRDLRSPNCFLMSIDDEAEIVAKLGDFGLAQAAAPHLTDFLGTWQWLAPEVLNAVNPKYDHRSDIFSFAIVFSEIMARQLPYSNYSEFVIRQEHPLTEEQLADSALVQRLVSDGMIVDLQKKIVVSETWQEQAIKSAIRDSNLRPLLPATLGKKIRRTIELAWDFDTRVRPPMTEVWRALDDYVQELQALHKKDAGLSSPAPLRRAPAQTELPKPAVALSPRIDVHEELSISLARSASKSQGRGLRRKNHIRVLGAVQGAAVSEVLSDVSSSSDEISSEEAEAPLTGREIMTNPEAHKLAFKSTKSASLPSLVPKKERAAKDRRAKANARAVSAAEPETEIPASDSAVKTSTNSVVAALLRKRKERDSANED